VDPGRHAETSANGNVEANMERISHRATPRSTRGGWTLVELLAVFVVLAILVVSVVTRYSGTSEDLVGEAALLRARIRFAQSLAMRNNTDEWTVRLLGGGYALLRNGAASDVPFPGEADASHILPTGVSITAGTGDVVFDEQGSAGATDRVIVLNGQQSITVTGQTGYVP